MFAFQVQDKQKLLDNSSPVGAEEKFSKQEVYFYGEADASSTIATVSEHKMSASAQIAAIQTLIGNEKEFNQAIENKAVLRKFAIRDNQQEKHPAIIMYGLLKDKAIADVFSSQVHSAPSQSIAINNVGTSNSMREPLLNSPNNDQYNSLPNTWDDRVLAALPAAAAAASATALAVAGGSPAAVAFTALTPTLAHSITAFHTIFKSKNYNDSYFERSHARERLAYTGIGSCFGAAIGIAIGVDRDTASTNIIAVGAAIGGGVFSAVNEGLRLRRKGPGGMG